MANRKEYEMLFQLNAQLDGSYNSTFKSAQSSIASMQKEISALSKTQSDISAYQKQQNAVEATGKKLDTLKQQYDNIQKEIQETEGFSSSLENQLLSKQQQIDKTTTSLDQQTQKLGQMDTALKDAGVDTSNLGTESGKLGAQIDDLKEKQAEAADEADNFGTTASQAFGAVHQAIVAAGIAVALKEIAEAYMECVDASVEFESAMTGVAKTTEMSDTELAQMAEEIKTLSTEIPITTTELANVAEVAGQLGIAKDDLMDFSTVMSMLGTATTMTADDAATLLAQMASITQMDPAYYSNLASAIVDLGNNYSTTEQKITDMAQGIAASANLAGMSEADMVALAAAVTSLGFEAGMGSTAISKLTTEIQTAVDSGEDLESWAGVAGMSAAEFAAAWGEDAVSGLEAFIVGLGNTEASGGSLTLTLQELGITETRMSNVIKALATSGDRLSSTLATANSAWDENTALVTEAEKRYGTTESQLMMLQNSFGNLKIAIGDSLTPTIAGAAGVGNDALQVVTEFIQQNPELVQAVTVFVGILGTATVALTAYAVIAKVVKALDLVSLFTGPAGAILGVVAGVAALTAGLIALSATVSKEEREISALTAASREQYDELQKLNAEYEAAKEQYGENSAEAKILRGEIELLSKEFESSKITLEEFEAQLQATADAYAEIMTAHQEATDSIATEESVSLALVNRLNELASKSQLAASEQVELQAIIDSLNESVPGLALSFDSLSGSISLTADEIIAMAEAEAAARQYEADNEALIDLVNQQATAYGDLVSAQEETAAAQRKVNAAQKAYDEKSAQYATLRPEDRAELIWKEASALQEAQLELDSYISKEQEAQDTYDEIERSINAVAENIADYAESLSEATDNSEEYEDSLQRLIALAPEYAAAIYEAYNTAYEAAYSSLMGQISLTQEWENGTKTSVDAIVNNIDSYTTAFAEYNENLKAALESGLDPAIAAEFFGEVSGESSAALAAIAEGGEDAAARVNEAYSGAATEAEGLSGTLATVSEDFITEINAMMDEAGVAGEEGAAELVSIIANTIIENGGVLTEADTEAITNALSEAQEATSGDAKALGEALPAGMASGVFSGASVLYAAMRTVVANAIEAGKSEADSHSPSRKTEELIGVTLPQGIAVGALKEAEVAEEALREVVSSGIDVAVQTAQTEGVQMIALAPQLMSYFSALDGGYNAISAESGSYGGGYIVLNFAPEYNLTGASNAAELEAVLREHDENLKDYILEIIEEAGIDAARGAYR